MNPTDQPEIQKEISCRITKTLLAYVRENNAGTLGNLLDGLALGEGYLTDTNNWVSHAFLQTLYHRMVNLLKDHDAVYKMSLATPRLQSLGLLDRIVRLVGNPRLIYSQIPKYNNLLKLNGAVIIREIGDTWVLLEDRYHDGAQKTHFDCDYARGIFASIPTLFDLPPADIQEIECQVSPEKWDQRIRPDPPPLGRGACLYRIRWSPRKKAMARKRLFDRKGQYLQAIEDLQLANQTIQSKYDEVKQLAAELEKANQRLKESEEKYRELVKYAPAGIYEFDMTTLKFISVNDVMCEYSGYSETEFLNLNPHDLLAEESKPTLKELIKDLYAGRKSPPEVEYKIKAKNGREFWVLVYSKFFFEDGVPKKAMCVVHDLTAIRQAQEEKKNLEMQLINVQKLESLGTLAGGVAHDFNNLLTGIQGNVSLMMLDHKDHHPLHERLKHIESYVRRGSDLTRQLLGLARGGKYDVKSTDLNELLKNSATMFGRTKKEIRIHDNLSAELWPAEVDRGQIEQVLLNLFVNAWQAMPLGGELRLETGNTVLDDRQTSSYGLPEGKYIKIAVTDTGTGMDKEIQGKIFDPFFTTKEVGRGTGLGLASSYGIIKNHKGFITVSSKPGVGSTFSIYLPASEKSAENADPIAREIVTGEGKVLLVDDEEIIIEIDRQILEKLGYETRVAKSGREALDIYRKHQETIDLVILDMIMPDMNGGDLFDRLKTINPQIKVLLSSGYSVTGQATDILNRGCSGFIQKPFNIPDFSEKISKILTGDERRP